METTTKHLEFIRDNIPVILHIFDNKELKSSQIFALGLLERLYNASFSFSLQVENYQKFKQLDFSIGLTLRALILDSLISFNLYKIIYDLEKSSLPKNEIEEVVDEYCNRVLADGLQQTIKYFSSAKEINLIDDEKLTSIFTDIGNSYSFFLKDYKFDGTEPKVRFEKPPSNPKLFKRLAEDGDLQFLSQLYDAYSFYSKYDHFGILYFRLIRQNLERCLYQFKNCIRILLKHLVNLLFILNEFSDDNDSLKQEIILATNYNIKNNS